MSAKLIAVVGASGGLGKCIVKKLANAGNTVRGVVRPQSIEKTKEALGTSVDVLSVEDLDTAFNGVDIVIEVVSNSERPDGIRKFVEAAEKANVNTFVACGGAFGLFTDDTKTKRAVSFVADNADYVAMNDMHMKVQEIAFASTVPTVFQICPPYMPTDIESTGNFVPALDIAKGVMQVHYDDVAACLVEALKTPIDYNRGMMAIAPKTECS